MMNALLDFPHLHEPAIPAGPIQRTTGEFIMDLSKNMGSLDRTVRLVAGIAVLAAAFYYQSIILGFIAIVLLATSAMAWCPAYLPFGIKTNKTSS